VRNLIRPVFAQLSGRGPLARFTVPLSDSFGTPLFYGLTDDNTNNNSICVNTIYTDHTQLARDRLGRDRWEEDNRHT
jgi:hypothetical protein